MSVSCVLEGLREDVQAPGTIRAWCSLSIVVSGYDRSVNGSQLHDAFRRFQSPVKKNIFYELFSKKYKQVSWVRARCWCLAVCIPAIFKGRWAEFKRHACEQQPLMSASPAEFSSPAEYRLGHGKHQTAAILSDGAELRAHDSISDNKNPPLPCGASVKPEAPSVSLALWPLGGRPPICEVTMIVHRNLVHTSGFDFLVELAAVSL